jgi:hypothetical protein
MRCNAPLKAALLPRLAPFALDRIDAHPISAITHGNLPGYYLHCPHKTRT